MERFSRANDSNRLSVLDPTSILRLLFTKQRVLKQLSDCEKLYYVLKMYRLLRRKVKGCKFFNYFRSLYYVDFVLIFLYRHCE